MSHDWTVSKSSVSLTYFSVEFEDSFGDPDRMKKHESRKRYVSQVLHLLVIFQVILPVSIELLESGCSILPI